MNQLPLDKRAQIINLLVDGSSLRAASRISGCSINTVTKLLVDIGRACQDFHNLVMTEITTQRIQCDEIWSFVYAKQKNVPDGKEGEAGDVWTWVGMDADSKLVISWLVGNRDADTANILMQDIASRLTKRVQLTTDGHKAYLQALGEGFGSNIDYAQLIKLYGIRVSGQPDMREVSTSYVERQNLTMQMYMRRFTRLTNAFSKKIENHCYAIALHIVHYNFAKIHKTLRVTPAMEAGITKEIMSIEDIVKLTDKNSN